jgi:hypothetical protein
VEPTDVRDPNYYHRVVDCQWACPAHTDVPGYIRLISQGQFDEAYLLNRSSNVFPGVLGRTCDRPCEPACRRGRVDGTPVAICRLKRVTADLKGDITDRLAPIPEQKNGKRVALIGAGPSSLTVADPHAPRGYEVPNIEKLDPPRGRRAPPARARVGAGGPRHRPGAAGPPRRGWRTSSPGRAARCRSRPGSTPSEAPIPPSLEPAPVADYHQCRHA